MRGPAIEMRITIAGIRIRISVAGFARDGGAGGDGSSADGGNGGSGVIIIEEHYGY